MTNAALLGDLLRRPREISRQCREGSDLRQLVLVSLTCVALGAVLFGATVGSFRGGLQIAYSALKLPLVLLATLVVCVPAFHAFEATLGTPRPLRGMIALTVAATARAALLLVAFCPLLWLAVDWGLGYHSLVLLATLMYGLSGLAAMGLIVRGLAGGLSRLLIVLASCVVFGSVGAQTAWMLRPFFGRPAHQEVPFVRAREGSFADAVQRSVFSAAGLYEFSKRRSDGQCDPPERCAEYEP